MARQGRTFSAVLLLLLVAVWPLVGVGNAQTNNESAAGKIGKYGVAPSIKTTVGKITSVSPSSVPREQNSGIRPLYTEQCHRQLLTMEYDDSVGKPFIKFTGVHEWCFDGQKVTKNSMPVQPWISPKYKYQPGQDGYRYVPSALKSTDRYFTYNGHWHGAQRNTRLGRFEYHTHGISKPTQVLMPFVSRVGHYDGTCTGPLPSDRSPRVVSVKPTNASRNVPATANVEATFFSDMDPATINGSNFYLFKEGSGAQVGATVRYDAATKTAILNPRRNLSPGATYRARIYGGPYGVLTPTGDPIMQQNAGPSFTVAR